MLVRREKWLPRLEHHPLFAAMSRLLLLLEHMLMVMSMSAAVLDAACIVSYRSAASEYADIISGLLGKPFLLGGTTIA